MNVREGTATNVVLGAVLGMSAVGAVPVCERCPDVNDAVACCDGCGDALCRRCWGDGDTLFCAACWHRRRPAFDDVIVRSGVL